MGADLQNDTSVYRLSYRGREDYILAAVLGAIAAAMIGMSFVDMPPFANRVVLVAAIVSSWGTFKTVQNGRHASSDATGYLSFAPDVVQVHLLDPTKRKASARPDPPTLRIPRDKMLWIRRAERPRHDDPTAQFVEIRVTPNIWREAKTLTQAFQSFDDVMNDDPAVGTLQLLAPDILRVRVDGAKPNDDLLGAWAAFDYPHIDDHTIGA